MRSIKRHVTRIAPVIFTSIPLLLLAGCERAVEETAVYKRTYISVCEDLDTAAADMEIVIRGAAEPSPDWERLEGIAESVYKTFSSCTVRMNAVNVPAEYKAEHKTFTKALTDGRDAAADVLEAVRTRDCEAVVEAAVKFEEAGRRARAATELLAAAGR
ncbi:MAG: hypothetical protein JSW52_10630 [Candidatus Coatesbacteria bacterium]|nr:MAG: hypothetical protein JSW52_10630 [Candidatus Coatesbacteria bacterium]